MKGKNIKHVKYEDAPEEWLDRCSGDGYERYTNEKGERVYSDNNIPVGDLGIRPCARCGKYPTLDGDDACLSNLGKVMNACCGHGKNKGYVQFDSGHTIRGFFEVEMDDPYDMPYQVRARKEIFDRIEELEEDSSKDESGYVELETLKWVMKMEK